MAATRRTHQRADVLRARTAADKASRHARIVAILGDHPVRSQAELSAALTDAGFHVAQATLSRDLDELGAVKLRTPDGGLPSYVIPEDGAPLTARTADDAPPQRLARLVARPARLRRGQRESRRPAYSARGGALPGIRA